MRGGEKGQDGKLPAHVITYLTLALCLFSDDDYTEVATKVTGSLDRWGCWDAAWTVPTPRRSPRPANGWAARCSRSCSNALRPGRREGRARPRGGGVGHRAGVVPARWRLLAIDGFEVDLPDSRENAAEFGYAGSGENRSAFPKARVVALAECGTHAFVAAEVDAYPRGEDPGGHGCVRGCAAMSCSPRTAASTPGRVGRRAGDRGGAAVAGPDPTRAARGRVLADGTYLTVLIKPTIRGRRRERLLAAARERAGPDRHQHRPGRVRRSADLPVSHLARVIEYDVPDRDGNGTGELIVPADHDHRPGGDDGARADELAAAYHQRWEQETANDQLKTHLRGPGRVLRSRLPDLVHQEIWAYLIVHHAISALTAKASAAADLDPDRVSFAQALRLIRRTATGTADIPA